MDGDTYDPAARLELFPITTRITGEGLTVAGCDLVALAAEHGTPLYVYDQATMDAAVAAYGAALARFYPGPAGITYAAKAFLCLAIAQWVQHRNLWLDCTGAGEIAVAVAAGLDRRRILVHGVNKSAADLEAALLHAGTLVVDNLVELERIAALAPAARPPLPDLWLRLRPGLAVATHHAFTQTGQEDSKFGMSPAEARQAVALCQAQGLRLTGIHFHQGSHFHDPQPISPALEVVLELLAGLRRDAGWLPGVLSPGGGWGVAYHESELPHPEIDKYVRYVARQLEEGCRHHSLPLPRLQFEPGRSLMARAGVALYRLGAVKHTAHRRWLLLDGGLTDNVRPALYGARYSALPVWSPGRPPAGRAWLAGPICESGDILVEDLPMPDVEPGELIAVPVGGAYQLSMSSNYNGTCRPSVLWLAGGQAQVIRAREEVGDLYRLDRPLAGLA
jgi:diaminopimelate decarboxylase